MMTTTTTNVAAVSAVCVINVRLTGCELSQLRGHAFGAAVYMRPVNK